MTQEITYDQMKGAIGSLLSLWADIERVIRVELTRANAGSIPKSAHGIAASLNAWEESMQMDGAQRRLQCLLASHIRMKLQRPLDIRNGVCHGLCGITSSRLERPAAVMWELNGTKASVSWDELQDVFAWLSVAPRAISIVSTAAVEEDDDKIASMLPDRDWWRSEFAFDLPASR